MTRPVRTWRTCETSGCDKPHKAHGMCDACYVWSKRHGKKPESAEQRSGGRPRGVCKVSDCGRPVHGHGLCSACYSWLKRHGEEPTTAKGRKPGVPMRPKGCETPDCDRKQYGRGLCGLCHSWWLRHGEKPPTARVVGICEIPGCDKKHNARGMCQAHYDQWKKRKGTADGVNLTGVALDGEGNPKTGKPRVRGICEIPGCDRPHESRGMCLPCYGSWHRNGVKPETAAPGRPPIKEGCETQGCLRRKHHARGLCNACYDWWLKYGVKPETVRPPTREFCETPGCGMPHKARGLCNGCYKEWSVTGERPTTAIRPNYHWGEATPAMVYRTEIVDLDLTADEKTQVWILGRQQSQMYNLGVEIALHAIDQGIPIPTNFTAYTDVLTPSRKIGTIPTRPAAALQRAGLRQGLLTVRMHRSQTGKYRASLEYRSEDIMKAKKRGNTKELEKLERMQARTEHKLDKLLAKGSNRLFRRRRDAETGPMPALRYDLGVRVSETHLRLPGGLQLKFRKPFTVPEGYVRTGCVEIVDAGSEYARGTEPPSRRFRAHICIKKVAPTPPTPETEDELLGIDLGIAIPVCTSTGKQIYLKDAEQEQKLFEHIKYLKRCMARCKPGSRRYKKLSHRKKKAHRKRANRRKNASRDAAKELVDHAQKQGCVMIVAEDLKHRNMQRVGGALGATLWRGAMGRLQDDIERRCLLKGIGYIKVPPHGTSQQCNACGTKGGRENQAIFLCSHCGWFGNADYNAAINIRARGWAAVRDTVDRRCGVFKQTNPVQLTFGLSEQASSSSAEALHHMIGRGSSRGLSYSRQLALNI